MELKKLQTSQQHLQYDDNAVAAKLPTTWLGIGCYIYLSSH
jgi:hypothetical protein